MRDAIKILKAMADPTRLRIMLLMRRRELCVCELMFILGMEQSRISHHMRILRDAGIAEDVRDGRWIIYRVPEEARTLLEGLFAGLLQEHIGLSGEASEDARKLKSCIRENIRGRVCKTQPRVEGH
jgi:DNA-binding transcriptional ArsR family regulator